MSLPVVPEEGLEGEVELGVDGAILMRWSDISRDNDSAAMPRDLPGPYQLRSAVRVLRILGGGRHTEAELLASYRVTPSGGILSSNALVNAQKWLIDQGWLTRDGNTLRASAQGQEIASEYESKAASDLLRAIVLDSAPIWLSATVVQGEVRQEFLRRTWRASSESFLKTRSATHSFWRLP